MANNTLNGTSAGLPGGLYIFLIALNIFLSITATLGNALILVALRKISSIYPPTKLLFRCLAVTDLCVGLLCQPLDVFFILADFRHINFELAATSEHTHQRNHPVLEVHLFQFALGDQ